MQEVAPTGIFYLRKEFTTFMFPVYERGCSNGDFYSRSEFASRGGGLSNPFKRNGISHFYQMDQSIFVLRVVGWSFSFYSNFNRTFCKQRSDATYATSDLGLHCLPMSHKKG